ncbi:MAG: hypothetical protein ACK4Z6_03960 [Candidatus Methylomirabilales bacterium]
MGTVRCAFCGGKGSDPFGLLSPLARCQVCLGRGGVAIQGPTIQCAYCRGSGIQPYGVRITCQVCGGRGMVPARAPTRPCLRCGGSGRTLGSGLPCLPCRGLGAIAFRP